MAAKIVSIINQKGGCGKTTLAMNLAGALGLKKWKVLVVDLDVQRSSDCWHSLGLKLETTFPADFLNLSSETEFVAKLDPLLEDYDVIILDCPPAIESQVGWTAAVAADLVLVPVIPDTLHVFALNKVEELLQSAHKRREECGYESAVRLVLNKVKRTVLARKSILDLKQYGIPFATTQIGDRTAYGESVTRGSCVGAFEPQGLAAKEMEKLSQEVIEIIGNN